MKKYKIKGCKGYIFTESYIKSVMARSVSENLKMNVGEEDYLDLKKTENRQELLEFQIGYSDKGILICADFVEVRRRKSI